MSAVVSSRSRSVSQASDEWFLDPITHEPIVDAVIDECGHTFDRSTIGKIVRNAEGIVICPLSRREINVDRLRPNLLVNSVSSKYHVLRKDSDEKEDENAEDLSMHDKLNLLIQMNFKLQKENKESKKKIDYLIGRVADLSEEIIELKNENVSFKKQLHKQKKKTKKSNRENKYQEKELDNYKQFNKEVLNMSVKERFEVFVGSVAPCCDHLKVLQQKMNSRKLYDN